MNDRKAYLKRKLIDFQREIGTNRLDLRKARDASEEIRGTWILRMIEIVDRIETVEENSREREATFDKQSAALMKSVCSLKSFILDVLQSSGIRRIDFPDHTADMATCRVVDTLSDPAARDGTIAEIVKHGYRDTTSGAIVRKADMITVLTEGSG